MKASQEIKNFIANEEGFRDTAYQPIPGDKWTVGFGFTILNGKYVQEGDTITEDIARNKLSNLVDNLAYTLSVQDIPDTITQNQFDAVVSLVYNIGMGNWHGSNTAKDFYAGLDISAKFPMWDKSQGEEIPGLLNRRLKEQAIYSGGY